jgi:hypothetical protein
MKKLIGMLIIILYGFEIDTLNKGSLAQYRDRFIWYLGGISPPLRMINIAMLL